jgi:integrase
MARQRLTDKSLRRPPPATGQEELWDDLVPGFGLRVAAGGARTFFVMKRINGKLVRRTVSKATTSPDGPIGRDELRLGDARAKARQMIEAMSRGDDPAAPPPAKDAPTGLKTFGAVADAYLKDTSKRGAGKLTSKAELQRKIDKDLVIWKDRPINEITKAEIVELIVTKRNQAEVASNRLLSLIKRVFGWAAAHDIIPSSPATYVEGTEEAERNRVLSLAELGRIWTAAEALGQPYGPLIQLLVLTAQRRNEVAEMRWSEVDGSAWRLPDDRSKRGKGHLIPLSPRAVSILGKLTKIGEPPTLVFTTGKRAAKKGAKIDKTAPPAAVSGWSRMKARLDKLVAEAAAKEADEQLNLSKHSLSPWTLHDVRRSVATHLRDADVMGPARVDRLVVSKILNHAEGGMTRIYDRYAADTEQRAALEAWALVIERTCGLNVVPMPGKRA